MGHGREVPDNDQEHVRRHGQELRESVPGQGPREAGALMPCGFNAGHRRRAEGGDDGGEGLAHGEDGGRCGAGDVRDDRFVVTLSRVERRGEGAILKGEGPMRAHRAQQISEEGEGVLKSRCIDGARGPAGLARPGRAQSEGGSHAEGVAVGQEHEAVRGG